MLKQTEIVETDENARWEEKKKIYLILCFGVSCERLHALVCVCA